MKWLLICSIVILAVLVAIFIFKVTPGSVFFYGILLACPLMHFLTMKSGDHK